MEIRNFTAHSNHIASDNTYSKDLSVNDFLQIMAAEMKNQTPFSDGSSGGGGSKTDYLTQMAQFTMLEQMQEIGESLNVLAMMNQQQYTIGLIGKEVTVTDGNEELTGVVEKVKFQDGYAVAQVNGKEYNLGSIVGITNVEEPEPEPCCNEAMEILMEALGFDGYRLGYPRYEGIEQGYPGYENIGEDYSGEDYMNDYPEEGSMGEVDPGVSE
ncbi:MAG: hypothetical protein GX053_04170 [Tissierella sp.]|nr:hypothetical protein [Tissierella sp.]